MRLSAGLFRFALLMAAGGALGDSFCLASPVVQTHAQSTASNQEHSPQLPCLGPLGLPTDLETLSTLVSRGPIVPSREGRTESQFYAEYDQEIERWFCALDALSEIHNPSVDETLATLLDHPTFRLATARKLAERGSQLGIEVLTSAALEEADCARVEEAASWLLSHQRPDGVLGYFRMLELSDDRCVRWVELAQGLATVAAEMPDLNYVAKVFDLRTHWPDRFERVGVGLLERGARVDRWHEASCAALRQIAAEPPSKLGLAAASAAEKHCPRPQDEP
jgi:hypothetical protein